MPAELKIPISALIAFLLVLVRVSGVFAFIPIPGAQAATVVPRAMLSVAITFALIPKWPAIAEVPGAAELLALALAEAAMGVFAGVLFSYVAEAFAMGAQILSLQAGYGYASAVDPNTQADSGILIILSQLLAGMLFFATGLDRQIVAAFAASLDVCPPGSFASTRPLAEQAIRLAAGIFSLGWRIALPVAALLLMIDVALGVLGRINAQLQVTNVAFPAKMMLALAVLASAAGVFPALYRIEAARLLKAIASAFGLR